MSIGVPPRPPTHLLTPIVAWVRSEIGSAGVHVDTDLQRKAQVGVVATPPN